MPQNRSALQSTGGNRRFMDEFEYTLDGLKSEDVSTRQTWCVAASGPGE